MRRRILLSAPLAAAAGYWGGRLLPGARAEATMPFELTIGSDDDELAFAPTEMSCPANAPVRLTFTNNAKYITLEHNWVLVKPGTWEAVDMAGLAAGEENNWLAPGDPNVIAATRQCQNGESDTIEFTAPDPGDYTYICTFPGHAAVMNGVLHVIEDLS